MVTIIEQIFDFKALKEVPFVRKVCDMSQPELTVRATRIIEAPDIPTLTKANVLAQYESWLAEGVDPEIAVINLREVGFVNPDAVLGLIEDLRRERRVDGAVAECTTMVKNEIKAYIDAELESAI